MEVTDLFGHAAWTHIDIRAAAQLFY